MLPHASSLKPHASSLTPFFQIFIESQGISWYCFDMEETYGFESREDCLSKVLNGHRLVFKRLFKAFEIEPYMDMLVEIWGLDDRERIPVHEPVTVASIGGLFLGLTLDEKPAGFMYVLPARLAEFGFHHHSNFMGFVEKFRNLGLAMEAKRAHAILARREAVNLVTWTFDPFQAPNASLNFRKLGGICRTYREDAYGGFGGTFNAGLPTDRFLVEWHIDSERVKKRLSGEIFSADDLAGKYKDVRELDNFNKVPNEDVVKVCIPESLNRQAAQDLDRARGIQLEFRRSIRLLFGHGFTVTEFISLAGSSGRSNFYILERGQAT